MPKEALSEARDNLRLSLTLAFNPLTGFFQQYLLSSSSQPLLPEQLSQNLRASDMEVICITIVHSPQLPILAFSNLLPAFEIFLSALLVTAFNNFSF